MKLNQVIAVMNGTKKSTQESRRKIEGSLGNPQLFQGIVRDFTPVDDEGFIYPSESQNVTLEASSLLTDYLVSSAKLFDMEATLDFANTEAKSSVVVEGTTIILDAPVTYLMFLEKQLQEIKSFVASLPVLPIEVNWAYDENRSVNVSEAKETVKTKKITDFIVVTEATKEHAAQVRETTKDIIEGTWKVNYLSGALSKDESNNFKDKIQQLLEAVIKARENANGLEVIKQNVSENIIDFLVS